MRTIEEGYPVEQCEWPGCENPALCQSGNFANRLVCNYHLYITNGTHTLPSGECVNLAITVITLVDTLKELGVDVDLRPNTIEITTDPNDN